MNQADLGDTLCPVFMFCDLRESSPSLSQEEAPSPPQTSEEMRGTRGADEPPGAGPHFHRRPGHGEMRGTALSRASRLKQTSHFQKMEISKINEADYCLLLKRT